MAKDVLRIPFIFQPHQPRQLLRSKCPGGILITMCITHVNLWLIEPTRLLELGPQVYRQFIRISPCRTRRVARECHFKHDLRVDIPPRIGGLVVRHSEDGLGREKLNFQDGPSRFRVLGVHGSIFVEGVDEGWRIEVFDARREAGVGIPFGTNRRIETEARGFDEIVPGEGVDDLHGGFEIEERFYEGLEFIHGARVDGVEYDDLLLRGQDYDARIGCSEEVRRKTYDVSGRVISNVIDKRELWGKLS